MYTEITYSTQVFLPSIVAGVLLVSAAVSFFLYFRLRLMVHLATAFSLLNSFCFTLSGAMLNYCGDSKEWLVGMQLSRFEQLFAAAYIPIVPFLLYSFGAFWVPRIQKLVIALSLFALLCIIVVAFGAPDLFVSVTTSTTEALFKESCYARGKQGPVYWVRDILLGVIFVYGVVILRQLATKPHSRGMAGSVLAGVLAAMILALNDIINAYTMHKLLLPPVLDFSWSSLGMGIFGILVAKGAFQMFLGQLTQSEQNHRNAEDLVRNVVDAMDSVVIGLDTNRRVTLWNKVAASFTAISSKDALGKPIELLLPKVMDDLPAINDAILRGVPLQEEKRKQLPSGEYIYEDFKVLPLSASENKGAVLLATNITEKKRLQETIIQTEKMLSVGGLAAGMAHEINNPLAGMMQNAQLAKSRLLVRNERNDTAAADANIDAAALQTYMVSRRIPEILDAITVSGVRATHVVRNMLDFSRKDTGVIDSVCLSELIESVLELAQNDWDLKQDYDFKNIRIVREYQPDMPLVPCENQNMSQVFFNLIKNAAQAMHDSGSSEKPTLTVRTKMSDTGHAHVEIEDNGPGVPKELIQRIFDPFFTTKEVGRGSGLGLSVSYFIVVEHHHGRISVVSPASGGARFIVELPITHGESCVSQPEDHIPSGN